LTANGNSLLLRDLIIFKQKFNSMKTIFISFLALLVSAYSFAQTDTIQQKESVETVLIEETPDENTPLFVVDEMPEYPGGEKALREEVAKKIVYPESAQQVNVSGTVYLRFVVTKTGEVSQTEIMRGVHPDIDKEALRVINELKPFKPGKQDGKPVDVYLMFPIFFNAN
jgi:TonB family protein